MLSRLETVYLGLLRGFILIAATLALIAAVGLIVSSAPALLTRMGIIHSQPQSSSLAEFISEQKASQESDQTNPPGDQGAATDELPVDPVLHQAAQNFHSYLGSNATISVKQWEQGLQSYENAFPAQLANDYSASVKRLSEELKASQGKPLSEKKVAELVDWHKNRFAANRATEEEERAAADAAFIFKMEAAFAAFMLFAFITFIFLFVRIERNLRLMRVEVANG